MPLITCQNAAFAYDGDVVLSGLNFTIEKGDYLCIVGENGAGKTTLVKGLLHQKMPCSGRIEMDPSLKPTQIGYLPQQTVIQQDFPASVYEVVLSGCLNSRGIRPFYTKANRLAAQNNIARMGLSGMERKEYRFLSGGQKQRALLARALCATHTMLLLDEPVARLDPLAASELYKLIDHINKQMHITIVMVSHDIHSAVHNASHILHLHQEQVFFGTTQAYVKSDAAIRFFGRDITCLNS